MITGKEDLMEAIAEAFAMEKGTKEFYDYAAERALSDTARRMFASLRDWEQSHMQYLIYLYQSLMEARETISYEEYVKNSPSADMESGMSVKEATELFERKEFIDDTEAILQALEIEGKAFNLYRQLSESAGDNNARVIFEEMKKQEQKHIDELRNLKMMVG